MRRVPLNVRVIVLTFVVGVVVCLLVVLVAVFAAEIQDLHHRQAEGRRTSIAVICGAMNGVIQAGRSVILAPTDPRVPVSPLERSLERLGYPPRPVRRTQALQAASRYAAVIAQAVRESADGSGRGVVRRDGTLNCGRLQVVAHTSP